MVRRSILLLFLVTVFPALAGCASQSLSSHGGWFEEREVQLPEGNKVFICHAFTCGRVTPVVFSESEIGRLTAPFGKPMSSAAEERKAVSQAVQTFERIVGRKIGTSGDRGGLEFGGGDPSQMDCIDEATNTTSLLLLLSQKDALKFHEVARPVARGFFLDGRYPHATAVLRETGSKRSWAVDSWPIANAEPPVIQDLSVWIVSRGSL
jgi:hypothetical protein